MGLSTPTTEVSNKEADRILSRLREILKFSANIQALIEKITSLDGGEGKGQAPPGASFVDQVDDLLLDIEGRISISHASLTKFI